MVQVADEVDFGVGGTFQMGSIRRHNKKLGTEYFN